MKNLFLHQFFKDLRQTWILWALWFLFTIGQFAMAAWNVGSSNIIGQSSYSQMISMIPMIHGLILFVLIPALILQEPTVGVSAFWLTRPIPRGTVLGSKLLALLILVLIPTFGQCTVLLAHGVMPWDVFLGGIQIALHELSWIAFILMLATLSPNFTRYLIAAVVLYALQFAADWIYTFAITLQNAHKTGDYFFITPGLNNSRMVVSDTLRIFLSLGVVIFQYQTRRTKLAISLAAISVLISFFTSKLWPKDFLSRPENPTPTLRVADSNLNLGVDERFYCQDLPDFTGAKPQKMFSTIFRSLGGDVTKAVNIQPVSAELTLQDGEKIVSLPLLQNGRPRVIVQNGGFLKQSLDAALSYLPTVNCQQIFGQQSVPAFILKNDDFEKYNGQSGKLAIRVKVQLSIFRVKYEWPLVAGAVVRNGSERMTVNDVLQLRSGVKVDLQTRRVSLMLHPTVLELGMWTPNTYVVVSPSAGEAMVSAPAQNYGNIMNLFMNNPIFAALFSGIGIDGGKIEQYDTQSISFSPRENYYPGTPLPINVTKDWLSGAKLYEMEKVPVGEVEKTLIVDNFKITSENNNRGYEGSIDRDLASDLKGIELPKNPSRADAWKYILKITGLNRNSFSERDPEVDLLTKVGQSNADELFMAIYNNPNAHYDLVYAINKMDLSGTRTKDLTLSYLPQFEDLIKAVVRNHWEFDAEGILVERVNSVNRSGSYIQDDWVKALASVRDPSTYPALLTLTKNRIERNQGNPEFIRAIPGSLISAMLAEVWKKSRGGKNEFNVILTAASWGVSDALKRASEILVAPSNRSKEQIALKNRARDVFRDCTASPDHLLDTELSEWYDSNANQLQFDPQLGRFLIHAKPAQSQDASWPGAENFMRSLGERAAKGDTIAVDEIVDNLTRLTEGLDPVKDLKRVKEVRQVAWSAFNVLRSAFDKDPSVAHILEYANTKDHLNQEFIPNTYSLAAANGNEQALESLIHYQDHNWSLFDAITNLDGPVANNNPQAVDFILSVYNDPATASLPNYKQLKEVLINQIKNAANAGNEKAKALYQVIQTTK